VELELTLFRSLTPSKAQREDLMRLFALNRISFIVTPPLFTSNVDVMNQWCNR